MHRHRSTRRGPAGTLLSAVAAALLFPALADAQWVRQHEQFQLPAQHNWQFRQHYQAADRLFNAFDYGHAILYELLYTRPGASVALLEQQEYDFITRRLLVSPPRLPVAEAAVEVQYAKLVPEAKLMFEWAHVLHRVIYDIWADERLDLAAKDRAVAEALRYYQSRPDLAFSSRPKNMELMEEQTYSLAFRRSYPRFNGLIWAYHWLQVGLYDALMAAEEIEGRQRNVNAAVAHFWQMLGDAPLTMPRVMPMTAAVAPRFAERYPEAAIIFDNLHGLHDVISDVLASPLVPRERKRAEILLAAERYRDDSSFVMERGEWIAMAAMMGAENMGGVADPTLLGSLPTPTLEVGATHAQAMEHHGHGAHAQPAPTGHEGHAAAPSPTDSAGHVHHMQEMMALHMRMLGDSAIRRRVLADTVLRGMMERMIDHMPEEHREHMREMLREPPSRAPAARTTPRRTTPPRTTPPRTTPPPSTAPRTPQAPRPVDPHAGHRPPPEETLTAVEGSGAQLGFRER